MVFFLHYEFSYLKGAVSESCIDFCGCVKENMKKITLRDVEKRGNSCK